MSYFTGIIAALKRNFIPVGLVVLLFPALFLGDGLQPLVDIYISCAVLLWSVVVVINHKSQRRLPNKLLFLWLLVLVFTLFSIFRSTSPGLSVSAFVRVLITFVVFFVVYVYSTVKHLPIFLNSLLTFVTTAAVISFLFPFFPQLALKLPTTNLLYAFFGHNHLGALLLVTFPVVLDKLRSQKNFTSSITFGFYLLSFLLTFGRGVFLIISIYLIFSAFKQAVSTTTRSFLLLLAGLPLVVLFSLHLLSINKNSVQSSNTWLTRQIFKSDAVLDSRSEYFFQALSGFKAQPILGTGPGTFLLTSQRYARVINSTSVYAHSFPLEILSETGLVGLLIWGCLLAFVFSVAFKHPSPLSEGTALLFLYSFIDFSLNFILVWLIFWAAQAFLSARQTETSPDSRFGSVVLHFSLILLGGFYISAMLSLLPGLSWLTPYNRETAKTSLPNSLTRALHFQDPDVLFSFYRFDSDTLSPRDRLSEMFKIVKLSPFSWTYHGEILSLVTRIGDKQLIADEIVYFSHLLSPHASDLINQIDFYRPEILNLYSSDNLLFARPEKSSNSLFRFYYLLGYQFLATQPELTRDLWLLARTSYPQLGLIYAEEAALSLRTFHDFSAAKDIIAICDAHPQAKSHCLTLDPDLVNLNTPGDLKELVLTGY